MTWVTRELATTCEHEAYDMASDRINIDMTEIASVIEEINYLCRGKQIPPRLLERMQNAKDKDAIRVDKKNGVFVARPGPELLCILVDAQLLR